MALLNRSGSNTRAMRAVARQREKFTHDVKVGDHAITVDEPVDCGGDDLGPSPQELLAAALASCTAVTMEMYAQRKGWDISGLAVDCRYTPAERGCPTRFELDLQDAGAPRRGADRAAAGDRGQVPGPPHARGRGHVRRAGRARLSTAAELAAVLLDAATRPLAMDVHGGKDAAVLVPLFEDPSGALHAVFTRRRHDLRRHPGEISFPGGRRDARRGAASTPRCARRTRRSGCRPTEVDVVGALPPTPTFVTNYAIYPFVGVIEPGFAWVPQDTEVAEVLELQPRRSARRLRRAPAGAEGHPVPHADVRGGRRPRHLGRDRPHPGRRYWGVCSSSRSAR